MRLIKGLPENRLLQRIQRFNRITGLGERALSFYLLDFHDRGLCKKLGCSSTVHFALMKLALPRKKTRELLRVARALEELTLIDAAFAEGRIAWSAVREITRVAVKDTEAEWLELAESSSLRCVERAVSRAKKGDLPPDDPYGLPKTRIKVTAELPVEDYAVWEAALSRLTATSGPDLDASSALVILARAFLEQPLNKEERKTRNAFQVVYHRCSECDRAWVQTDDGPAGVEATKVAEHEAHAGVVRLSDSPSENVPRGTSCGTSEPETPWVPKAERDLPNTPLIREQVLSRDGKRCAVPGCGSRGNLFSHHVVWKAHGGRTVLENEVCVCQRCHGLIHEGHLKVEGVAPHRLRWTGADGRLLSEPLAVDHDKQYRVEGQRNVPRGTFFDEMKEAENTAIYSLDEIPDEIDSAWWRKHQHNFMFKGNRIILKNVL